MTNPTRQEILDAHEALDEIFHHILFSGGHYPSKAREQILAALPPIPRPTMAEVEWDNSKHYLAEADHASLGKVVMLSKIRKGGEIYCIRRGFEGKLLTLASPENLTPTGRRYVLYVLQEGE
ncbi:hypothetical protein GWO56_08035 [Corynebacterium macginleyi]|uniref:hypothetical protein n=1 Tax=Corynebacterium macginleyi TaxID=38290 RepID=UPI00190E4D4E|nr:hypothetical protein [Corynebacterium macginleyi]MBK4159479.1 hypothetical protein [Corynebacterium macginleyi]